jgi:hypothetical protein
LIPHHATSMILVGNFFGSMSLENGCWVIALTYTVWSFIKFIFNLASFSSPNFNILVAYVLLLARVDTFGRMWYALASLTFWVAHIVANVLLLVGIQKGEVLLMHPFALWSTVGIIWEFFFILFFLSTYTSTLQMITVTYILIINMALPAYFIVVVSSYATYLLEGMVPMDSVILKNTMASSHLNKEDLSASENLQSTLQCPLQGQIGTKLQPQAGIHSVAIHHWGPLDMSLKALQDGQGL